jgi:ubiquinone/menaquinone biosynthesis C-methylase UbiE
MDKNYYKEYFSLERNHWWFKVRAKIILLLIDKSLAKNDSNKQTVLNIGAATGKTSEILAKYGEVTSLEYDKECCEFVNENLPIKVINGSILELPFADNTFDLVCAFDVIEHVEDDKLALAEMKRVCKPNGLITVTVPAFMSLWSHHDIVNQHFRRYTKSNLTQLFTGNSLNYTVATYYNSILFLPIFMFRLFTKIIPQKWIRKGAGSDATLGSEDGLVNKIMYQIFNIELTLLKAMKFPFGVSIFMSAIKK